MRDSRRHGRKNKRPTFWVPESFHPENTLPPRLLPHCQSAYYLMHCIIVRVAFGNRECARLKMEYLRNVMGRQQCEPIMRALLANKEIRRVAAYANKQQSFGYLPGEQYEVQKLRQFRPTNPELLQRLLQVEVGIEAENQRHLQPIHDVWQQWQLRLSIDLGNATRSISCLPTTSNPYDIQSLIVARIHGRAHRFSVDGFGRVHNSITSLHRTLRPALRIKRQPLASVDIVNSQPALLALLMHQHLSASNTNPGSPAATLPIYDGKPFTPPEGFLEYQKLATTGQLYEHLMAKTGQSRREVKVGLLRDVFGKRGRYPSVVERSFRESFPGVWSFVRRFNGDDHGALLKELQRVESRLVIHNVGNRLSRSGCGPCVSLHDSVYCRRDDLGGVKSAFAKQFKATGFALQLKVA